MRRRRRPSAETFGLGDLEEGSENVPRELREALADEGLSPMEAGLAIEAAQAGQPPPPLPLPPLAMKKW